MRAGLDRGHRVVYVSEDDDDAAHFLTDLAASDGRVDEALEQGQVQVHSAAETYSPDGAFDPAVMRSVLSDTHARALADGYAGLSMAGDMSWTLGLPLDLDDLVAYEHGVTAQISGDTTLAFLCIYDHGRFAVGTLAEIVEPHRIDVSPELAQLARVGYLAASRVLPGPTLRLCGELDFACAESLAGVLDAHYHGTLRLDLAELGYVDVAGLRALRGRSGRHLNIASASQQVRRLIGLLGWDTDPGIEIAAAA